MTHERMIELLEIELLCVKKNVYNACDGDCEHCELVQDAEEVIAMYSSVIQLLKTQKPKVIAFEDIHRGMTVWLEDIDKEDVILAIGGSSCSGSKCFITEKYISIAVKDDEYNKRWRAWTQPPTDEQRKAIPWDG